MLVWDIWYNFPVSTNYYLFYYFMKMMEGPGTIEDKATAAPEKEIAKNEELKDFDQEDPKVSGGVSEGFGDSAAVRAEEERKAATIAAELKKKAGNAAPGTPTENTKNQTPVAGSHEKKEKPLDVSLIRNTLAALEAKKPGFFDFGRTKDSIDLLTTALKKINGSGDFARDYMAALDQGGDKLAMEYARDIGAGKLVYPKDGVLMVKSKSSDQTYMPQ